MEEAESSPFTPAFDVLLAAVLDAEVVRAIFVSVGLGEPSACSEGAGDLDAFVPGAKGTLLNFFCGVPVLGRFLSAIGAEVTINGWRERGKLGESRCSLFVTRSSPFAFCLSPLAFLCPPSIHKLSSRAQRSGAEGSVVLSKARSHAHGTASRPALHPCALAKS